MRFTLFVLMAGCSGDKDATDTDTDTDPQTDTDASTGETGEPPPDVYDPTWAGVQQLFVEHCDVCHPSEQGIDLHVAAIDFSDPYTALVVPGDPDNSYLWQVVSGAAMVQMPLGLGLLPAETVQCIHDWIEAGAVTD